MITMKECKCNQSRNTMALANTFSKVAILIVATILLNRVQSANATILVISKTYNETVFSAEEVGIDAASAFDLKGNMIVADPINACGNVKPPPTKNHTIVVATITGQRLQRRDSWILWATYNFTNDACSLSRKAKEAESAGYSAIVITVYGTNDTSGILPSFMGFDWMGVRIYTSVLGENMGNALKAFAYPKPFYVQFRNEPYFQLGLLANFIFLGCMGIIIVVVLLRILHCVYLRISATVHERRRKRKAFLTEAQLKKLPVLHWRTSIPQDTCSICIENFEVGEEIRVLPCSHVFHKPCIDPWLIHSSRRCPNCKGKVIFPNEHLSDSSNSDSDSHIDDSDDDYEGNERTPLLRGNASDSDEQMEDTGFIDTVPESHNLNSRIQSGAATRRESSLSKTNSLLMDETKANKPGDTNESSCLIDISSDSEQISDDSFGSFQSAHTASAPNTGRKGSDTMLVDIDCNVSMSSAKSFESDKTFVGEGGGSANGQSTSKNISRKTNDEHKTTFGSNTSFFSCLESELEKSTTSNNEIFQSFSS